MNESDRSDLDHAVNSLITLALLVFTAACMRIEIIFVRKNNLAKIQRMQKKLDSIEKRMDEL